MQSFKNYAMPFIHNNVIIVSTRAPYPVIGGDGLRVFKIAEYLASKGRIVTILTLGKSEKFEEISANVFQKTFKFKYQQTLPKIFLSFLSSDPLQSSLFWNKKLRDEIVDNDTHQTTFIFHLVRTSLYWSLLKHANMHIEFTDAISLNYLRMSEEKPASITKYIYAMEKKRVEKKEKEALNKFQWGYIISQKDKDHLLNRCDPSPKLQVVPNGVEECTYERVSISERSGFCAVANFHSASNYDSLALLNALAKKRQVNCIGAFPRKAAAQFRCIQFLGFQDDLYHILTSSLAGICAVRFSAGMQNKILNYMAAGLPALSTRNAIDGLPDDLQKYCIEFDGFTSLKKLTKQILEKPEIFDDQAYSAQIKIRKSYNWSACLKNYD